MLTQIGISIALALGLSLIIYFKKMTKEDGEAYDYKKLIRTLTIGLILGIVSYQGGFDLTEANWETYTTANAGVIVIADQVLAGIWRFFKNKV